MSAPMIDSKQYAAPAYAGTLPFIACAVLPWIGMPVVASIGSCAYIAAMLTTASL